MHGRHGPFGWGARPRAPEPPIAKGLLLAAFPFATNNTVKQPDVPFSNMCVRINTYGNNLSGLSVAAVSSDTARSLRKITRRVDEEGACMLMLLECRRAGVEQSAAIEPRERERESAAECTCVVFTIPTAPSLF